jgi:hypothetical protein
MVTTLNSHLERGEYESLKESDEFALRLIEDLHVAGQDIHMMVAILKTSSL